MRLVAPCLVLACLLAPATASGQAGAAPPSPAAGPDPDLALVPWEPDFTLGALPTSLRLPRGKTAFRMTHRFTRPIASGSFGDFASSLFGFDGGAKIGIEFRYGLRPGLDVIVHRTNDRTIQLVGRQQLTRADTSPVGVTLVASVDGRNNFGLSDELELPDSRVWTPALGAIVTRRIGERGAVYVEPIAVGNAVVSPVATEDSRQTLLIGVGARWRFSDTSRTYFVVEAAPRVAGARGGAHHVSLAIEKRAGGHIFQLNVSNSLATTIGQLARGGASNDDWYIGFNLTRRFY